MSGMDRDFPMTPTQRRVLLMGFAVWIVAGIILFGGFVPGVKPSLATTELVTIQGHSYHVEYSQVEAPILSNASSPWNVTFFNVTFELWLTNWYSTSGGTLNGIGTEPNGSSYPFVLGVPLPSGLRSTFYLSPDFVFGVGWPGGALGGIDAQLYVEG